jgi:hypothetical protein
VGDKTASEQYSGDDELSTDLHYVTSCRATQCEALPLLRLLPASSERRPLKGLNRKLQTSIADHCTRITRVGREDNRASAADPLQATCDNGAICGRDTHNAYARDVTRRSAELMPSVSDTAGK